MKSSFVSVVAALVAVQQVSAHSIFQDLWVNGVDQQASCVRMPLSNSPITDPTSDNIRCNGRPGISQKCTIAAGGTATIEMHAQPGDRSCADIAIGGAHYGPVIAYMTKVTDASTADGSTGWFKIFQDGWAHKAGGTVGDDDYWGTNDLNTCCGRMNVLIPAEIPAGDYLLRAEAIALHVAGSLGGAQFYASCYQLTVTGGGSASPGLVNLPGAYSPSDPGILVDIHASLSTYIVPGPTVYSGGTTKSAGAGCSGVEAGTTTGPAVATQTAPAVVATGGSGSGSTGGSSCSVTKYGQCGGTSYTGCTSCASGSTCSAVSPPSYSQCL